MRLRGPLLTLLAGVVLAAVLLTLSAHARRSAENYPAATTQAAAPTASATRSTPPPGSPTATYAGRVVGGGATVAVTMKNGRAVAYFCDGNRTEAWLRGAAGGGRLTLTGASGGQLTATYGATKATGTVTVSGRQWRFDARLVHKPSGLWRSTAQVRGAKVVAGWVVLSDGSQVGIATVDGVPGPAPRLDPATGSATVNGATVGVAPVDPTV